MHLKAFALGYICVAIESTETARFLNLCNKRSICLWNVCICEQGVQFYMYAGDYELLMPILKKTESKAVLLKKEGLPFLYHKLRNKPVFLAMLLLCSLLWMCGSYFLWDTSFEGNSYITDDQLQSFLQDKAIHMGMPISKIPIEDLEKQLRDRFDLLSWVGIKMQGTTLVISVKENDYIQQEGIQQVVSVGENIVAPYDGVVDEIFTRSGTPMVKAGDTVAKGDILVQGSVTIKDDSRTIDLQQPVAPTADIIMTYRDEITFVQPAVAVRKQFTGREERINVLYVGKGQLCFPFQRHLKYVDRILLYPEWNSIFSSLPIQMATEIRREYYEVEYEPSDAEIQKKLEEEYEIFHKSLLEKGVQILEKNDNIDLYENLWVLEVQLLLREKMQY